MADECGVKINGMGEGFRGGPSFPSVHQTPPVIQGPGGEPHGPREFVSVRWWGRRVPGDKGHVWFLILANHTKNLVMLKPTQYQNIGKKILFEL